VSWFRLFLSFFGKNTQTVVDDPPLVRTYFADDESWKALLLGVAEESEEGFRAYVTPVSDTQFEDAEPAFVAKAFPKALVVFVADQHALEKGEILCIDGEDPLSVFRARVPNLWVVENNISVANLTFEELKWEVDEDGVMTSYVSP